MYIKGLGWCGYKHRHHAKACYVYYCLSSLPHHYCLSLHSKYIDNAQLLKPICMDEALQIETWKEKSWPESWLIMYRQNHSQRKVCKEEKKIADSFKKLCLDINELIATTAVNLGMTFRHVEEALLGRRLCSPATTAWNTFTALQSKEINAGE